MYSDSVHACTGTLIKTSIFALLIIICDNYAGKHNSQ